jgi:protein phosphatase
MKIEIAAKTEKGKVRSTNQDNFRIAKIDKDTYACVVCDGMGGASGGSEASCIAAVSFMNCLKECYAAREAGDTPKNILKASLNTANSAVYAYSLLHPELEGMGTTLVGFILSDNDLTWINVGDSRLYAASAEGLYQISSDHSLVRELVAKGVMSEEEAKNSDIDNIITRAVGIDEIVESDVNTINDIFDKYSYILLCSDGLTSMISHDDIYRILTEEKGTQRKIDCLLAGANDSGGYDNITAVLLAVTE